MRVWLRQKNPKHDLKKHYNLIMRTSLAVVIGLFVIAFNINMAGDKQQDKSKQAEAEKQETIHVKEVVRTMQKNEPPRPPSPQPPVEVPNNEIIEGKAREELAQIDQQLSSGQKMKMPPPPEQDKPEEKVFTVVEQQPKLIGGLDTLNKMIEYPQMAQKAGIQGRVYVRFVVSKQGDVVDPEVVRGPGAGLNKEALRVISKAEFRPGIQQGHPVKVKYTMPIVFQLDKLES